MILRQFSVEPIGKGASLHRSNPHDRNAAAVGGRDDIPGPRRPIEPLHAPRGIEKIRDALDSKRRVVISYRLDDRVRDTDPGDPPARYPSIGHKSLESGNNRPYEQGSWCARYLPVVRVRHQLVVKEEKIDVLQLQSRKALRQTSFQQHRHLVGRRGTQPTLRGDANAVWELPAECISDDTLRLTIAVTRSNIEKRYSGLDCFQNGGYRFIMCRRSPYLADAASAERERADHSEASERALFHGAMIDGPRCRGNQPERAQAP